jgi:hypothetical protein
MPDFVKTTIRMDAAVYQVLAAAADQKGVELGLYLSDLLAKVALGGLAPHHRRRIEAQRAIREEALEYAQEHAYDPDVILHFFQWIRNNNWLCALYADAIGGGPIEERLNHTKAALNRGLGRAIKYALKAETREEVKNLQGELILSYHKLGTGLAKAA